MVKQYYILGRNLLTKTIMKICKYISKLTAVATKMGVVPDRNRRNAVSRSGWLRSPWMDVTGKPKLCRKSSNESAPFFVSTNTRVRDSGAETHWYCTVQDSSNTDDDDVSDVLILATDKIKPENIYYSH